MSESIPLDVDGRTESLSGRQDFFSFKIICKAQLRIGSTYQQHFMADYALC